MAALKPEGDIPRMAPWFIPRFSRSTAGCLAALLLVGRGAALSGQEHRPPSLNVTRLAPGTPVRIDGELTESFWQTGATASNFRQREPAVGQPATEATEVRVAIDGTTIYVGILARDSRPDQVIARVLQRDQVVRASDFEPGLRYKGEDVVAILLDPFHDRRSAYVFATNANGAEFDALVSNDGREINTDWRGVWRVASRRTPEGWSAEFAIPLRSIRYPSDSAAIWGFNVVRYQARTNEETVWTSWGRDPEGFHRVSNAGHLLGIGELPRPGANLDVKPYLLAGGNRTVDGATTSNDSRLTTGVDLKTEVAPGMVLDLTAHTDFAQAEVDDQKVNLTRFNLFFPEKRDFFLENAGIFEFGFKSAFEPPPFLMFFSRRIGVADDGPVPLLGGLRLTGRAGRQSIGVLDVVTDPAFGKPRQNHAVVRFKRDFSTGGYLGAMATDERSGADWNSAGGVDFLVRPSHALTVLGYAATTAARSGPMGFSGRIDAQYQTDRFGAEVAHMLVDRNTRADLGFVTRTDIQRSDANIRVTARPKALGLRRLDLLMYGQLITNTAGTVQDWMASPNIVAEWNSGDNIFGWYTRGATRLEEGFAVSDSVPVPAGLYDTWSVNWYGGTSARRPIVLRTNVTLQGIYGGRIDTYGGELSAAPSPNFAFGLQVSRSRVDLPGGHFTADLGTLRLTVALSTKLAANSLIQYNAFKRDVSMNLRIGYTFRPGSDLFLVFNELRGDGIRLWAPRERAGLVKLTYLARL